MTLDGRTYSLGITQRVAAPEQGADSKFDGQMAVPKVTYHP